MSELIATLVDPAPDALEDTPLAFLRKLGQPTEIRLSGRDSSRARALSTLLHGNEPSSVFAIHRWLRSGRVPAVDLSIFVMAVDAALSPPGFAKRMLPGRRDLNRCFFPPFEGQDGWLAERMLTRLRQRPYEALIDLHNNTGRNPAYGIINRRGIERLNLVKLFTHSCCVLSDLHVGALTEAIVDEIPSVAIECGHSADSEAHKVAYAGVDRFASLPELGLSDAVDSAIGLFDHPIRVELRRGISVAFDRQPNPHAELTLRSDIDAHNFCRVDRGTVLGWLREGAAWPFTARGGVGKDVSRNHFSVCEGTLFHDSDLVPIMMTTNAQIALVDCLCYLMHQHDWLEDRE